MIEDAFSSRAPGRVAGAEVVRLPEGAVVRGTAVEVVLNPTALALWELCDGTTDVEEMVSAVCRLFAVDRERARHDVECALSDMQSAGVIA